MNMRLIIAACGAAMLLAGCATGSRYAEPKPALPDAYSVALPGTAQATAAGLAIAASGILRGAFPTAEAAAVWLNAAAKRNWRGIIEFTGPAVDRRTLTLWPGPGGDFEIMKKIKDLFDPRALLNRGRLHGRL